MVPRAYVVDEIEGFLICEYLSDYKSFVDLLRTGQVSAGQESVAIQVGTNATKGRLGGIKMVD